MSRSPVTEALEGALETSMEQLASDQADALRAAAAGDIDLARQHLSDAHTVADQAKAVATVLIEEEGKA